MHMVVWGHMVSISEMNARDLGQMVQSTKRKSKVPLVVQRCIVHPKFPMNLAKRNLMTMNKLKIKRKSLLKNILIQMIMLRLKFLIMIKVTLMS